MEQSRRLKIMPIDVLKGIESLECGWLSKVLQTRVTGFDTAEIVGEGYASRMYRLSLHYADGQVGPESLILKLATVNAAQENLHEVATLFREVNFYAGPAAKLQEVIPKVYFSSGNENNMQLTILMEDLGLIPHKPFKETLENSIKAMQAIAKVHATYWNDPILKDKQYDAIESAVELDSIVKLAQDSMKAEQQAAYSYPYLNKCMHHVVKLAKWMINEGNHLKGDLTLIHGDFHARNIHFLTNKNQGNHLQEKDVVIFDWQTAERGNPVRDVVYWILTSVPAEDQVNFKEPLIRAYLDGLRASGIKNYGRKQFDQQYLDAVSPLIPRLYCYQELIEVGENEEHIIPEFLDRTELMAKSIHYLAAVRVMRVFMPIYISILRLLGKR
ncbi:MAG: hypothetical protein ACJAVI_001120 [Candidatus Azotimanducaceae bacterium]